MHFFVSTGEGKLCAARDDTSGQAPLMREQLIEAVPRGHPAPSLPSTSVKYSSGEMPVRVRLSGSPPVARHHASLRRGSSCDYDLVELLDTEALDAVAPRVASGTLDASAAGFTRPPSHGTFSSEATPKARHFEID